MPVPPKLLRRLVLAPLVALLELALLVISPALVVVAVLLSSFFGGWRPLRMLAIFLAGAAYHLGATLACLGLWVASGFGRRMQTDHVQRTTRSCAGWSAASTERRCESRA